MSSTQNASNKLTPKISVIIPVFNRDNEVLDVIDSLNSQSYKNFEAIFIDDFSTVPLKVTLAKYAKRIEFSYRLHRNQRNRGVSYSRNQGVKLSDGDYICFLDSDDQWFPTKLASNIEHCSIIDGNVFAMSKTEVIKEGYSEILPCRSLNNYSCGEEYLFEHGNFAQVSSFFLSKSLAKQISFNESLSQYEDFLYFINAFNTADTVVFIEQVLVKWNDIQSEGRLSLDKSFKQSAIFIAEVKDNIATRYIECFYLRFVMPYYFYKNFGSSMRSIFYCMFKSDISFKTVFWMTFKGFVGDKLISKIRDCVKA